MVLLCNMQTATVKLEDSFAKAIDKAIKENNFSTKTEFIRDSLRNQLKKLNEEKKKEMAWQKLFAMKGALKGKSRFKTDEEWHNWRSNEGSKQLMDYYQKKFNIKF